MDCHLEVQTQGIKKLAIAEAAVSSSTSFEMNSLVFVAFGELKVRFSFIVVEKGI